MFDSSASVLALVYVLSEWGLALKRRAKGRHPSYSGALMAFLGFGTICVAPGA
jgi:hypothetical protein